MENKQCGGNTQILYASNVVSNLDWDNRFLPNRAALRKNLSLSDINFLLLCNAQQNE